MSHDHYLYRNYSRNKLSVLFISLVLIALCMRLWELDARVMHYDEAIHLHYSWKLANLEIFNHSPWMHGPLQIEFVAFAISLFGDTDFVARVMYAIVGSLLVGLPYFLRHQLGRFGAISISVMLVLSPSMLYFSRFGRNDILMAFWSVSLFILMIRYICDGKNYYLYLASAVLALMFCTKETSYLVVFIVGSICFLIASPDLLTCLFRRTKFTQLSGPAGFFLLILLLTLPQWSALSGFLQGLFGLTLINPNDAGIGITGIPHWGEPFIRFPLHEIKWPFHLVMVIALFTFSTYRNRIRSQPYTNGILGTLLGLSFGIAILLATLQPLRYGMEGSIIADFRIYMIGLELIIIIGLVLICKYLFSYHISICRIVVIATLSLLYGVLFTDLTDTYELMTSIVPDDIHIDISPGLISLNYLISFVVVATTVWLSFYLGFKWKQGVWIRCAAIFYFIWVTLYTTVYTNWAGIFTGGWQGLGYWIAQQDVARGNQPWYYYVVGLSVYELLPFIFGIIASIYYIKKADTFGLSLVLWSILTFLAFTLASEKMPWLLVGVVLPLIVLTGKYLDDLYCQVNWSIALKGWTWLLFGLIPTQVIACVYIFHIWLSSELNFDIAKVILISLLIISFPVSAWLIRKSNPKNGCRIVTLVFAMILFSVSIWGSFRASYTYDDSTIEFLAYAQGSNDIKKVYQELEQQVFKNDLVPNNVKVDYELWYPMQWYGRNHEQANQLDFACFKTEGDTGWNSSCNRLTAMPDDGALLLLSTHGYRDANLLSNYHRSKPLNNLLWFPESYRRPYEDRQNESMFQELALDLKFFKTSFSQRSTWKQALDYIIFRDIKSSWYSSQFFSYLPKT